MWHHFAERPAAVVIVALLLVPPSLALDPSKALTQYMHDGWQAAQGLPQSSVFAICQTRDGYLWLGTQAGLARFDGNRFAVFNTRSGLRHNYVWALLEDRDGSLWIGTVGGGLSHMKDGQIRALTLEDGLPDNRVRALCQDRAGSIWVGTDAGLGRVTEGRVTTLGTMDGLASSQVNSLATDREGSLWIGTELGLQRFRDGVFTTWATREGLPHDRVLSLLPDRAGDLWIGTQGGLGHLAHGRLTKLTTEHGLGNDIVLALGEDQHGSIWVGTYGGGLSRLRDGKITTLTVEDGLSNAIVSSIYEDREGSLWIGTNGGGLNRLKDSKFTALTTREGLSNDLILSIHEDTDGVLWFGTAGGGLNRVESGKVRTYTMRDGLSSNIVFSTCRARDETLWIGTDGGLDRLEGDSVTHWAEGEDGPSPRRVRAMYEDAEGNLWIGTDGDGLTRLGQGAVTRFTKREGLSDDVVSSICQDADGSVWIGTEVGLNRLKGGKLTTFTTRDGLASDFILTLFQDGHGSMWIGTFGGLSLWADDRLRAFTAAEGITDGPIGGILEDASGNLWMSTNTGIFSVSRAELHAVVAGSRAAASPTWYGPADGMRAAECNGGYQPAGCKARDGRLWFPTVKGAVVIDPENIPINPLPPPVVIEQVLFDRVPLTGAPTASDVIVSPGTEKLEISYTACSLLATHRVRFKYRLDGFDRGWVEAGSERIARYTNLPPRRYTFHVIACNDDGVWNESGATFSFYLKPHLYQSPWFYALCAVGIVGIATGVHQTRVRRLKARQRELTALVEEKTNHLRRAIDELQVRNEEMAHLNSEKNELLGIAAHDLKNPLGSIRGYAEMIIEDPMMDLAERREILGKIVLASQRMVDLIIDLLEVNAIERGQMKYELAPCDMAAFAAQVVESYRRAADAKGQTIHYQPPAERAVAHADGGVTLQVCDNLLANAVKYSPHGKSIWVRVRQMDEKVRIEVRDEGPGISAEDLKKMFGKFARLTARPTGGEHSTGLGLSIVKSMVEAMHGRVWCESQPGAGATFIVELPASPAEKIESRKH